MRAHAFIWFVLVLLLTAGAEPAFGQFIPLGDLPGGIFDSDPNAVSGNGMVVVGASSSVASGPTSVEAFRWTQATGMVGLGFFPGAKSSRAAGVSADGSILVGT